MAHSSTTSVRPNMLQLLVENSGEGLFITDRERDVFLRTNPAMSELTGYSEGALLDASFHTLDLCHEEDRSTVAQTFNDATEHATQTLRFRIVTAQAKIRTVDARIKLSRYMGRAVVAGSFRDVTELVELERKLRARDSGRDGQAPIPEPKVTKRYDGVETNLRLLQIVESLKAVPELSKQLSSVERVEEMIRRACLYITDQDKGLQFGSCVIYLKRDDAIEVAYANPFRLTTRIKMDQANPIFARLLSGKSEMEITDAGNRLVPIHARGEVIGILEVGIGKTLARVFQQNDPVRQAQENVLMSIGDFIGIQIANIELREGIQQQVIQDKLTGLFNRRHFDDKLATEFKRAVRYERALTLMLFDLDHFKSVNDTHGHPQGDVVLQVVSKLLARSFRDLDTVCRIGGEEIAVIMPETSLEAGARKAEQIRQQIEELRIDLSASKQEHAPGETMRVTSSIGLACVDSSIESHQHLFKEADRALYISKHSGRNRVSTA